MESPEAIDVEQLEGNIEFKNVCFDYETTKGVLNDISFEIQREKRLPLWDRLAVEKQPYAICFQIFIQ